MSYLEYDKITPIAIPTSRKRTKLWCTKENQKIRICDMTDRHLVNTIKMLDRYHKDSQSAELRNMSQIDCMLNPDSEASWFMERDIQLLSEVTPADRFAIYYDLYNEALDRDLGGQIDEEGT